MFVVFISQEPLEFGSYFGLCKILLYQSFAVLLKINRLQQKLAFFSEKKKFVREQGVNKYNCQKQFSFRLKSCCGVVLSLLALCWFHKTLV